jgi:hypothetical protein
MEAYHLVCHDCQEEAMLTDRTDAKARRADHQASTDHRTSLARVEAPEA